MRHGAHRLPRLSAAAIVLFAILTLVVVIGWTQVIDDSWNTAMASMETASVVAVAETFHWLGSFSAALFTSVFVTALLMVQRKWELALAWIAIVGGSQFLSITTKILIGRERPLDSLVIESSAAYPSGHAMVAGAAMAIGIAMIAGVLWPRNRRLYFGVAVSYAFLMAWSRTYLRVHWLTDVVGGLLFGTAMVFAVMWLVMRRAEAEAA